MTDPLLILEKNFREASCPLLAKKQSDYLRNLFPFFGITKPQMRLLGKAWVKSIYLKNQKELKSMVRELWHKNEREFHYAAVELIKHNKKLHSVDFLESYEMMIRQQSWWDTVDDIASNLVGNHLKSYPELIKKMDLWIDDENFWIRRTALLFQLKYKDLTDEKRLFSYCQKRMREKEFFIRKAIGWSLREHSKTHPKSVKNFIHTHRDHLSPLSFKEASKYL
jgi:3-methyladenine DNA glycosylase AlkD